MSGEEATKRDDSTDQVMGAEEVEATGSEDTPDNGEGTPESGN